MHDTPIALGIALVCDAQGRIQRVIHDDLGIAGRCQPGTVLPFIVDRASMSKALSFLVELQTRGALFDWELNVPVADEISTLHFTGGAVGETLLVVASKTRHGARQLYGDMLLILNEQTNALRAALQNQSASARAGAEREGALYDEISRLNNELVAMQRELAQKNVELEKLNQLKNQFLGMAAHDLRNPLSIILSYSEFLLAETAGQLDAEQIEFLQTIRSSSQFMVRLVNDLLDVAQIESGKLQLDVQPLDLLKLVGHTVALNRVLAEKKQVQIVLEHDGEFPAAWMDAAKIEQVLNNLVSNAVKFLPPGKVVRLSLVGTGAGVTLTVQDHGPGIPANEMEKLFKPFSRTSVRSTAGEKSTGLGLVICRRIIEGHHGKIWADSEVGVGSTFFVSLPLLTPERLDA